MTAARPRPADRVESMDSSELVVIATASVAVVVAAVVAFLSRARIARFEAPLFDDAPYSEAYGRITAEDVAGPNTTDREFKVAAEYHALTLGQSRISFRFSLVGASIGFVVIIAAVGLLLTDIANVDQALLTVVGGSVTEAVATLFFVQSNRAQRTMVQFFDRLRTDRRHKEALSLIAQIAEPHRSRVASTLTLQFADAEFDRDLLRTIIGSSSATTDPTSDSGGPPAKSIVNATSS